MKKYVKAIVFPSTILLFLSFYYCNINGNNYVPGSYWEFLGFKKRWLVFDYLNILLLFMMFNFLIRILKKEQQKTKRGHLRVSKTMEFKLMT